MWPNSQIILNSNVKLGNDDNYVGLLVYQLPVISGFPLYFQGQITKNVERILAIGYTTQWNDALIGGQYLADIRLLANNNRCAFSMPVLSTGYRMSTSEVFYPFGRKREMLTPDLPIWASKGKLVIKTNTAVRVDYWIKVCLKVKYKQP